MAETNNPKNQSGTHGRLGKYQLVDKVAEGPLTEVWRARREGIAGFHRDFAARRLQPAVSERPAILQIVEGEVRAAAALAHGNIVQILDLGHEEDGRLYLVTEWVDGWSLADVLAQIDRKDEQVPAPMAAWLCLKLAQALAWAHSRPLPDDPSASFVHGDVSPRNILVSRGGEVKLSNFGLALAGRRIHARHPNLLPAVDSPAPPERDALPESAAGDVWNLGRTLTALLLGQSVSEPPSDLPQARPDLPRAFADLLRQTLVDEPRQRPDTETLERGALEVVQAGDLYTQESLAAWLCALFGEVPPQREEAPPRDDAPATQTPEEGEGLSLDAPVERTTPRVRQAGQDAQGSSASAVSVGAHGTEPSLSASGDDDLALDASPEARPPSHGPGWPIALALWLTALALGGAGGYALVPPPAPMPPPGATLAVGVAGDASAVVSVAGERLVGERALPPGTHPVDVVFEGGASWSGTIEFAEGERRLLVLEPRTVPLDAPEGSASADAHGRATTAPDLDTDTP